MTRRSILDKQSDNALVTCGCCPRRSSRAPRTTGGSTHDLKLLESDDFRLVAEDNNDYARSLPVLQLPVTTRFSGDGLCEVRKASIGAAKGGTPRPYGISMLSLPAHALDRRQTLKTVVSFSRMHSCMAAEYFWRKHKASSGTPSGSGDSLGAGIKAGGVAVGGSALDVEISVMNFANGTDPGGGYCGGARAQEEALCRQFPLYYPSLALASGGWLEVNEQLEAKERTGTTAVRKRDLTPAGVHASRSSLQAEVPSAAYPFGACCARLRGFQHRYSDVLFTPHVCMMRGDAQRRHRRLTDEELRVNFIAAAAPCRIIGEEKTYEAGLQKAILHTILAPLLLEARPPAAAAAASKTASKRRVLILGAWGCGAFGNVPAEMATRFATVLAEVMIRRGEHKLGPHAGEPESREEAKHVSPGDATTCRSTSSGSTINCDVESSPLSLDFFYDEIHFAIPSFREKDNANVNEFYRVLQDFCTMHLGSPIGLVGNLEENFGKDN